MIGTPLLSPDLDRSVTRQPLTILAVGSALSPHIVSRVRCFAERGHRMHLLTESRVGIVGVNEIVPERSGTGEGWVQSCIERGLRDGLGRSGMFLRVLQCVQHSLRSIRPDIVHVHYAYNPWAWVFAALSCPPLVVSTMGADILFREQGSPSRCGIQLTRNLLAKANLITTKSRRMTDALDHLGDFSHKTKLISWGVDLERFRRADAQILRRKLGLPEAAPVLLSSRILQPLYNIDRIVASMPAILATLPNAKLVIIEYQADVAYSYRVKQMVKELGLSNSVVFSRAANHTEMANYYSLADLTISIPDSDGLPQTLYESMACRTPVLVADIACNREYARPEKGVLFVAPTADGVASGVLALLADPIRREKIAEAGRLEAEKSGDNSKQISEMEGEYYRLVRSGSGGDGHISRPFQFMRWLRCLALGSESLHSSTGPSETLSKTQLGAKAKSCQNRPAKVFLGVNDIASVLTGFRCGYAALGIPTYFAVETVDFPQQANAIDGVFEQHVPAFLKHPNNLLCRKLYSLLFRTSRYRAWRRAISSCDVFHFVWNTFTQDHRDLAALKRMGKKIIVQYVGSDIRCKQAFEQEFGFYGMRAPEYGLTGTLAELRKKTQYLRMTERYADLVINFADQAQLALRPYLVEPFFPLDLAAIPARRQSMGDPVVVHAPSKRAFKGTDRVLAVFEQLQRKGIRFKPRLIENLPRRQAIEAYAEADVVVGELYGQGGGMLAREAMACGAVVVSAKHPQYPSHLPADLPLVHAGEDSLGEVLEGILISPARRNELAERGRRWVAEHCDCRKDVERLLEYLAAPDAAPVVEPTFFREHFVPESPEACAVYDRGTALVRDCAWYRKHIRPGERAGLRF